MYNFNIYNIVNKYEKSNNNIINIILLYFKKKYF